MREGARICQGKCSLGTVAETQVRGTHGSPARVIGLSEVTARAPFHTRPTQQGPPLSAATQASLVLLLATHSQSRRGSLASCFVCHGTSS